MKEFSSQAKRLVEQYLNWEQTLQPGEGAQLISVDEVASAVAAFYEKIRGVVDWQEEHLLRKTAIERMLKRRFLLKEDGEEIAEGLLQELIRGGHFPNHFLPASNIGETQRIIDKYTFLAARQEPSQRSLFHGIEIGDWLLSLAACEIEQLLSPPLRERALVEFMTEELKNQIRLGGNSVPLSKEEQDLQLYIAVQRSLLHLDEATLSRNLLERMEANWHSISSEELLRVSQRIHKIRETLEYILHHPLGERFYQLTSKYDTPYLLLGDIIGENPNQFLQTYQDPSRLEEAVSKAYQGRLLRLKAKIHRAALYSTISIFLTKILIALLVEIPLDRALAGAVNYSALGATIAIPPVLMLVLVLSARSSSEENSQRVVLEVIKKTYAREREDAYEISLPRKKKGFMLIFVSFFYLASFLLSFGALVWLLQKFQVSLPSIAIFLFFLSLVAFAGTKIRERARELMVIREREGFWTAIGDFFTLPLIETGGWLSSQIARYNIFIFLFNFLIEIPFQVFVEFLEQWRTFLKEKKEEIH